MKRVLENCEAEPATFYIYSNQKTYSVVVNRIDPALSPTLENKS